MATSAYSEKLKDPRWQAMREYIFQRDNYTCRLCLRYEDIILVLHHRDYLPRKAPWDYPNKYLITLCHDCHEAEHGYSAGITTFKLPGLGEDPTEEFYEYKYGQWIKERPWREVEQEAKMARFIFEECRIEVDSLLQRGVEIRERPHGRIGDLIPISKVIVDALST